MEEEEKSLEMANNYPEELREIYTAGLFLASSKYFKLDRKTSNFVRDLNDSILHKTRANPVAEIPQIGDGDWNQSYQTDLPPVPSLNGLIGRCSTPFEKKLMESDVRNNLSRLSFSKAKAIEFLLPLLNLQEENLENGIPVTVYDCEGKEFPMVFKVWASKMYVLTTGWNKFYIDHNLKQLKDFVKVWMFRHAQTDKLCFVITSRSVGGPVAINRRED